MLVLVVEDEAIIALSVAFELEGAGHRVLGPADSVASAIELVSAAERPDLALVDINLREVGGGVQLARMLWETWRVPSLFATGQLREAFAAREYALGVLKKPYAPEAAVQAVEVAEALLDGDIPPWSPRELELYTEDRTRLH